MNRLVCILCLLLLSLGATDGCDRDEATRPKVSQCLPQNSPEAVLANLVTAMRQHDFEAYRQQLDRGYEFRYRPAEVGAWGLPATHGLADELCAAKAMFTDPRVDTIGVRLDFGAATAVTDTTAPSGAVRQIDVSAAYLLVVGPWPGGRVGAYECSELPERFFFSNNAQPGCEPRYLLVGHYELDYSGRGQSGSEEALGIPESWGWLKHSMLHVSREAGGPCSE